MNLAELAAVADHAAAQLAAAESELQVAQEAVLKAKVKVATWTAARRAASDDIERAVYGPDAPRMLA